MNKKDLIRIIRETLSETDNLTEKTRKYGCCKDHIACAPTQECNKDCNCVWKDEHNPNNINNNPKDNKKMNRKDLEKIVRETLSEMGSLNEAKFKCNGVIYPNMDACNKKCMASSCIQVNDKKDTKGGTNKDKNKFNNKNKMAKQDLKERFSQLAGIKPLYEMDDKEMETKEITKEELMSEGPELWTALGGLVGLIGAAGITTQLQMMAEDPAIAEKYPKLEKIFTFLAKVGGAVGSGIK